MSNTVLASDISQSKTARVGSIQKIEKEFYEADVAMLDRYQAFSGELLRVSLLGIGVVGFFAEKLAAALGWRTATFPPMACFTTCAQFDGSRRARTVTMSERTATGSLLGPDSILVLRHCASDLVSSPLVLPSSSFWACCRCRMRE